MPKGTGTHTNTISLELWYENKDQTGRNRSKAKVVAELTMKPRAKIRVNVRARMRLKVKFGKRILDMMKDRWSHSWLLSEHEWTNTSSKFARMTTTRSQKRGEAKREHTKAERAIRKQRGFYKARAGQQQTPDQPSLAWNLQFTSPSPNCLCLSRFSSLWWTNWNV